VSLELDLFAALGPLCSNRVFPDVAPIKTARPYVTYQQVGGEAENFLESTVVGKRNARMQINVWADTRLAAMTLARTIEDTLVVNTALRAYVLGAPVSLYEDETSPPLYGTRQDFSVWF
jgi:hypothetical protein